MGDLINQTVTDVTKKAEFEQFLRIIKEEKIPANWEDLANAIGVHQNTITAWRKRPEFKEALSEGIKKAWENMERSGRKDWKMWEKQYARLKKENENIQQNTGVVINILSIDRAGFPINNSSQEIREADQTD